MVYETEGGKKFDIHELGITTHHSLQPLPTRRQTLIIFVVVFHRNNITHSNFQLLAHLSRLDRTPRLSVALA